MVVNSFLAEWPGPLSLLAPLYAPCYGPVPDEAAVKQSWASSATTSNEDASSETQLCPSFLPPGTAPLLEMTVYVAGLPLPVEVFQHDAVSPTGQPRTYYLVQSDVFRHRTRSQIYSFQNEDEMLTWLTIFNQAAAAVIVHQVRRRGAPLPVVPLSCTHSHAVATLHCAPCLPLPQAVKRVQLHDYHGGLSLMYIPERLRPSVLYVAHNAHYDATFPIPTPARRNKVYDHLGLNAEQVAQFVEHNGSFDMLRAIVVYLRVTQQGHGVVAVSPRCVVCSVAATDSCCAQ